MEKRLSDFNSDVKINSAIKRKIEREVSVYEYIKEEHSLIAMIVVDKEEAFEFVENVLKAVKEDYSGLKMKSFIYLLNEDNYKKFKNYSKDNQDITKAMLYKFLPMREKTVD